MPIDGKVALLTGASQGLGRAFTMALLAKGVKVLMTDVNAEQGQLTLREAQTKYGVNNVEFMKCDVTSQAAMEEAFTAVKRRFGGLDAVINNAGIGGETPELWEKCVDINLKGVIRGSMLAMDHMRTDRGGKGGVIINVSSLAGLRPNPYGPVYCATKHGVIGFTRSWAMNPDLVAAKVRLAALCPAFVDTGLVANMNEDTCLNVDVARAFAKNAGMMTSEYVAEGMLELMENEDNNGAVLTMEATAGKKYQTF